MSKKNSKFDLKNLINSRLEEAEKIKEENKKKDKAFQVHIEELHKRIHQNDDQFNDI